MPATLRRGAFCLLAFALASMRAEERSFGPRDLVSELLQRNPEIRAARARFEAATKRPSQAGTLPEPTASYTNFGVGHPFSRLNGSEFAYQGFGVSQEFPFPGKLGLASEEAKREAESDPAELPVGRPRCHGTAEGRLLRVAHGQQGNRTNAKAQCSAQPVRGDRAQPLHGRQGSSAGCSQGPVRSLESRTATRDAR